MFHDLDATLAALVRSELPLDGVDVSFVGPDDQFPPSGVKLPALSFFLYDVHEDTGLRASEWERSTDAGGVITRTRPPARITCSYLITAWPSESTPRPAEDEHRLLGEVLKVLMRHRKIPARHLRGELVGQEPPIPARIVPENRLQSLGEFWQAMGGRPKATLFYGVTLSLDVFAPVEMGPAVAEDGLVVDVQQRRDTHDRRTTPA